MNASGGTPIAELDESRIPQLRNVPVYAGGEEIGHVGDVAYDEDTRRVECIGIKGDWLGLRRQWVPAQGAVLRDDGLYLDYGGDRFEEAPRWDDDADLDADRYQQV